MEYKKEIVQNVSEEIKSLFSNDLNNLVSNIIDENYDKKSKLLESQKKDYLDTLDVGREIFPNPIENGLFRFCGKCYKCKNNIFITGYEDGVIERYIDKYKSESIKSTIRDEEYLLRDEEYLLSCSMHIISNDRYGHSKTITIISNYGNKFIGGDGPDRAACLSFGGGPEVGRLSGEDGLHGRPSPVYSEFKDIVLPLTQEYVDILNMIDFEIIPRHSNGDNHRYNYHLFNRIMHVYKQYHPRANEIFIIEQKTNKLLEKKNEIKILEANYQKKYDELVDKENQLINKEIKLQEDINVHKEKIKNLFKRENEVKLKETINSCKDELMSSALSLNDVISIIPWPEDDDYDIIKTKIDNVINIMNKLI